MLREKITDRTRGQWQGILSAIGLPSKALRNKHGPCPMCGGKDRFRFDDKGGNGTFFCSGACGAGNGVKLVMLFKGIDWKDAVQEIEKHIGAGYVAPTRDGQRATDAEKREELIAMWGRGQPLTPDDAAGRYLSSRGLSHLSPELRFAPDERYTEAGQKAAWFPAMLAKVKPSDAAIVKGEKAALHRTYLAKDGGKAQVSSPRKMLGNMPTGAAVRLMEHSNILGIAEGIETALSASILFGVPCWAALNSGLLQEWVAPPGVDTVLIFGDNDPKFAGQSAAFTLAHRLACRPIDAPHVSVHIPPAAGTDWNDVLLRERRAA